ncbi:MAG: aminodeoxychorismate/anthranilate synthase component II [Actinobacteria bacterium]|nr:aminodeoxychorismate/anthranilate synthase component II [Actinomycetota bacterium]
MAPRILLIDNFDSFVYNLAQYLGELGAEVLVLRNNATISDLERAAPDGVVISPGPGRPEHAGVSLAAIGEFRDRVPILGVCLGHQCIGQFFGAQVVRAPKVMHGKTSSITHNAVGVLAGLPDPLKVTRYHSLVVDRHSLPAELEVTAEANDGVVMALRHRVYPVEGVQFHPESILTDAGHDLIANFLRSVASST